MWFKQATLFQFSRELNLNQSALSDALAPLSFTPCLPALPSSMGWVSPTTVPDAQQLVYGSKRFWLICLQFEEKILPSAVVRDALQLKIEEMEKNEGRTVLGKAKQSLKDEIIQTLLLRAFTKKSRVYGCIDLAHQLLIVNSNHTSKVERFVACLKRAIAPIDLKSCDVKKPSTLMTQWLTESESKYFSIQQSCVLQDPSQQRRVIRCQQQDLLASSVQSFLKEGCKITQLALSWKDQIHFVLTAGFSLRSIQFQEAVLALSKSDYTETAEQRFDADFVMMTALLLQLLDDLLAVFSTKAKTAEAIAA